MDWKEYLGVMNDRDLRKILDGIDHELETRKRRDSARAFREIMDILDRYGLTMDDVLGTASEMPPQYANPLKPEQTWDGIGRRPDWFKEALDRGISIDTMYIGP